MPEIIRLSEAKTRGLTNYFTGRPCKHGHTAERNTNTRTCRECQWQGWLKAKAKAAEVRELKPKRSKAEQLEYQKAWAKANRDKVRKAQRQYAERNPSKLRSKWSTRRRTVKAATLPGYAAELAAIYDACPKGMEVDHIYPLNGETACGLHVPWNLQYLTPEANRLKSNKVPS